jgi:hypothetical protein
MNINETKNFPLIPITTAPNRKIKRPMNQEFNRFVYDLMEIELQFTYDLFVESGSYSEIYQKYLGQFHEAQKKIKHKLKYFVIDEHYFSRLYSPTV